MENNNLSYEVDKSFIIRKAVIEDYEAVSDLEGLEFQTHRISRPDYFKSLENGYSKAEFDELLACKTPVSWLAVQDGIIVGLCFGKIEETPDNAFCKSRRIAFIQDVITLPGYRGRGIATALINKAREQAIQDGAVSLELCVWNFNEGAIRLYEKMGMKVQYYRMEEVLTVK